VVYAEDIIVTISELTGIPKRQLIGPARFKKIARARFLAFYFIRTMTKRSLPSIGRIFHRDHTTILHGLRQIDYMREKGPDVWARIEEDFLMVYERVVARRIALNPTSVPLVDVAPVSALYTPTQE
jgi:chromosomal replication initiation ATPase DnaA